MGEVGESPGPWPGDRQQVSSSLPGEAAPMASPHLPPTPRSSKVDSLRFFPQDVEPSSPASLAGLRPYTDYVVGSDQILQEVRNLRPDLPQAPSMGCGEMGAVREKCLILLGARLRPCVCRSLKTSSRSSSPTRGSP